MTSSLPSQHAVCRGVTPSCRGHTCTVRTGGGLSLTVGQRGRASRLGVTRVAGKKEPAHETQRRKEGACACVLKGKGASV
jgi:hypothetical protein